VDLDVEAERRLQTGGEDLHLLRLGEMAGPREKRLKAVLEVDHRSSALAGHQLAQRVGSQGRAEASVQ